VSQEYADRIFAELEHKPFDRDLLDRQPQALSIPNSKFGYRFKTDIGTPAAPDPPDESSGGFVQSVLRKPRDWRGVALGNFRQ
jgi:hypothetical protein